MKNKELTVEPEIKGKKFGFYFAIVTSLLIAAAIIFTAFYSMRCITCLMQEYKETVASRDNLISTGFFRSFAKDNEAGDYTEINSLASLLKYSNYITYAYAYDIKTGRIFWSTETLFLNKSNNDVAKNALTIIGEERKTQIKEIHSDSYSVVIGMFEDKFQIEGYKDIFNNLKLFVILFLIIGVIISAFMSKMINKPLMDLVSGVQEFGKGNFKYKLKNSGFEEIDKLVNAYNRMSAQLLDLYGSLEKKVEERTKELECANKKLKETQTMMVHSEKMRSLGELVAGIAHEINNPINFIYGNIMILDNYQKDLLTLIEKYSNEETSMNPESVKDIEDFKQKIDLDFLKSDMSDLIKSCLEGVERTKNIVLDLKNFSRMDEMVFSECNIPKEIDTTLNILNNKIKNRIVVHKDYEENLPKIEAYGGQINQVFMNVIDNAQSAIKGTGDIFISVKKDGPNIKIEFKDTGCGIKAENLNKIFEPFYTTKPVGQGTGLGMSIAYKVIEAHNGKITVDSVVGEGTKFTIILPINRDDKEKGEAK